MSYNESTYSLKEVYSMVGCAQSSISELTSDKALGIALSSTNAADANTWSFIVDMFLLQLSISLFTYYELCTIVLLVKYLAVCFLLFSF